MIKNPSAFLRKLSPNAAKNWQRNSGAKRRVDIKDVNIALLPFAFPSGPRRHSRAV
jgi:hypothetical protein